MRSAFAIKGINRLILLVILAVPSALLGEEPDAYPMHQETADQGGNPLIDEMLKLDAVFHEVVSGVALGDGGRVHRALETMHGAMEKTHEGVHHGSVKLPKNNGRMKEFIALDKKFHAKLETLAAAAVRNDQRTMLKLTKELLGNCVQCHQMFRNP